MIDKCLEEGILIRVIILLGFVKWAYWKEQDIGFQSVIDTYTKKLPINEIWGLRDAI